jgi:hypothetical protein
MNFLLHEASPFMETGADARERRALQERLAGWGGAISGERRQNAQTRCLDRLQCVSVDDYLSQRPLTLLFLHVRSAGLIPHLRQESFHCKRGSGPGEPPSDAEHQRQNPCERDDDSQRGARRLTKTWHEALCGRGGAIEMERGAYLLQARSPHGSREAITHPYAILLYTTLTGS